MAEVPQMSVEAQPYSDSAVADALVAVDAPANPRAWPDPTAAMLADPRFNAIWQVIKNWDVNVPDVYAGYCGATGNHARAIFGALFGVEATHG